MFICGHTGLWFSRVRLEAKRCGWVPWSADFRSKYYDGYGFTWCQHWWFFRSWICSDALWKGPTPPLSCPQEAWNTTFPAWFFLVNRGKYHHLKKNSIALDLIYFLKSLVTLIIWQLKSPPMFKEIRDSLMKYLTGLLGNDHIASELLLLHLLSKVI